MATVLPVVPVMSGSMFVVANRKKRRAPEDAAKRQRLRLDDSIKSQLSGGTLQDREPARATQQQISKSLARREQRKPPHKYLPRALERWITWLRAQDHLFAKKLATFLSSSHLTVSGRMIDVEVGLVDELRSLAGDAHRHYLEEQRRLFSKLVTLVNSVDPLPLLSVAMFVALGEVWGSYYEPESNVNQLDYEILCGVVASMKPAELPKKVSPSDVHSVMRAVGELRYSSQTIVAASRFMNEPRDPAAYARANSFEAWLTIRGSAYPQHGYWFAEQLYGPYASLFFKEFGFELRDISDISREFNRCWGLKLTKATDTAHDIANALSGESASIVEKPSRQWLDGYLAGLLALLPAALTVLSNQFDRLLPERDRASSILQHLGVRAGEWTEKFTSPLSEPATSERPFLILPKEGTWEFDSSDTSVIMLANPAALHQELHFTLDRILSRSSPSNWPNTRARVVDSVTVSLLSKLLGTSNSATNVFYTDSDGVRYEMDGIVQFDRIVILIEGKGAPLKTSSRRGDTARLRAQLNDLIGGAWEQLKRDKTYILNSISSSVMPALEDNQGNKVTFFNWNEIRDVYTVIPTFDGLGQAGSNLDFLRAWEIIPSDADPWIVSVPDLKLVTEALSRPGELIGYLDFRKRWSNDVRVRIYNEADMLAMFLEGTDVWTKLEHTKSSGAAQMIVSGAQTRFDDWYNFIAGMGPPVPKPRKKSSTRVRRLVDELHRFRPPGWLRATSALLNTPETCSLAFDALVGVFKGFRRHSGIFVRGDENVRILIVAGDSTWDDLAQDEKAWSAAIDSDIIWFAQSRRGVTLQWACYGDEFTTPPRWLLRS